MYGVTLAILGGSALALYENRKMKVPEVEAEPTPKVLEGEREVIQIDYRRGEGFGQYEPTPTMIEEDSISLKVTNHNCVDIDVKLFYTTATGLNGTDNFTNDWVRRFMALSTDDWGGNFLDADGQVWVNDGVTLPYAFNAVVELKVLYSFGAGTMVSLSTQVGESIDAFLLRFTEAIFTSIGTGNYNLADMSTCGSSIYYNGGVCNIDFIQYNKKLGGSAPQQITITSYFPATTLNFNANVFTYGLKHPEPTNWNVPVEVRDLSTLDQDGYIEFVNSLLNQDLYILNTNKYSNNIYQVGQPLRYVSFDVDGNEQKLPQTQVIDPYQPQAVLNNNTDILIDGQTYATIKMLAGEFIELTMTYDKAGIVTYEEIKQLEEEQGKKITKKEDEDLKEAYLNFSGFKNNKHLEKLLLLTIFGLLILKK